MSVVPITSIVVRDRSRREMRNIDSLAESIRERGLLHPPVVRLVDGQHVLVAGARRLAACQRLGFDEVPVTVTYTLTDELAALRAEGEENTEREPFTPSEAVAHAERIEGVIAAQARERMADGGRGAKLAHPDLDDGKTRTQVAKATGYGRTTLAKAKTVVAAANDETLPEPVRETAKAAVVEMDRTGKVDGAHKKVEAAKFEHSDNGRTQAALDSMLTDDVDLKRLRWSSAFSKALIEMTKPSLFEVDHAVANCDDEDLAQMERGIERLTEWLKAVRAARPSGLRVMNGGRL